MCWGRGQIPNSGCNNQLIATNGEAVKERTSDRYQLLGRLDQGDISLTILNITELDSGQYGCRVHIAGFFNDQKHQIQVIVETGESASKPANQTLPPVHIWARMAVCALPFMNEPIALQCFSCTDDLGNVDGSTDIHGAASSQSNNIRCLITWWLQSKSDTLWSTDCRLLILLVPPPPAAQLTSTESHTTSFQSSIAKTEVREHHFLSDRPSASFFILFLLLYFNGRLLQYFVWYFFYLGCTRCCLECNGDVHFPGGTSNRDWWSFLSIPTSRRVKLGQLDLFLQSWRCFTSDPWWEAEHLHESPNDEVFSECCSVNIGFN